MEIGGVDILIPAVPGPVALADAAKVIHRHWPAAVFENPLTGDLYFKIEEVPFDAIEEIFMYKNIKYVNEWSIEGAVPSIHNTMIYLIHRKGEYETTIVADSVDDFMQSVVDEIKSKAGM